MLTLIAVPLALVLVGGAAGVWFFTDIPFRMGVPGAVPRGGGSGEGPRSIPDSAVPADWNSGEYTYESLEASTAAGLRTPGEVRESPGGDFTLEGLAVEPFRLESSALGPGTFAAHPRLEDGFHAYAVTLKVHNTTDQDLDLIYMDAKAGAGGLMSEAPPVSTASDSWPTTLDPNGAIELRRTFVVPAAADYDSMVMEVRDPGTGPGQDDYRNDEQNPDLFSFWRLDLDPDAATGPLADGEAPTTVDDADTLGGLIEATSVWRATTPAGRMLPMHGTPLAMGVGSMRWDSDASTDGADAHWFNLRVESSYKAQAWDFTEPGFRVFYGDDMKEADLYTPEEAASAPDRLAQGQEWESAVGFEVPEGFEGPVLVEVSGPREVNGVEPVRYWFLEI